MRKKNINLKNYLNQQVNKDKTKWLYKKGANFGIELQKLVGQYYIDNKIILSIKTVEINTNPNDTKPDIVIYFNNTTSRGIEIKSCKDGALSGVTICNSPELINDKDAFLINYTFNASKVLEVIDVYETNIFRLITINSTGKYKGCLSSTRDTGKKIKGRNFKDFIGTDESSDYTLSQLTSPELIRKTVLFYSASKLVDKTYNFTDKEITEALTHLKKFK